MAKQFKLNEESAQELSALIAKSMDTVSGPLKGSSKLIADIYTGRDPTGGLSQLIGEQGYPAHKLNEPLSVGAWRPPETTANLFLSRLRQIVTSLTPGVPSFLVKARIAGAAHLAEKQNTITRFMTDHGQLREAMRKAAFIGMLSPYFGVKISTDKDEKIPYFRYKYNAIEPSDCGYEPFHRRFYWHAYDCQYADLPDSWKPKVEGGVPPKPWSICRVTEVYHDGFRHGAAKTAFGPCPMSIFVRIDKSETRDTPLRAHADRQDELGDYVISESLKACPLVIDSFLDPAPDEDVAPSEVLSWIPLMRMIVQTLVQITREITTVNKTILFDKNAISDAAIQAIRGVAPGGTVFVGVDVDDTTRGVNATMRPVEHSPILNEYLAALSTYMRLFDDVTGVSPADRGVPVNPRKSATEAAAITDAANRRNQDRLEVMALMWTRVAQATFKFQRDVLGKRVDIPLDNGIINSIAVPDPMTACFSFDVDPVELGHMAQRGEINTLMSWLTVTTQTQQTFAQGMPRMTREALRRLGLAMGIDDVNLFLDAPAIEMGPEDRYIEHLQTQRPIAVAEEDQHDLYIAYYSKVLEKGLAQGLSTLSLAELQNAIATHTLYAQRRAEATAATQAGEVVPGMGREPGMADNNIQAALAAGQVPPAVPQQAGY